MSREAIVEVDDLTIYRTDGISTGGVRESVLLPLKSVKGELIRCKDCKSYQPRYIEGNEMLGRCQNLNSNFVTGMGYCYWAERKEE